MMVADPDAEDHLQEMLADAFMAHDQLEHVVIGNVIRGRVKRYMDCMNRTEFMQKYWRYYILLEEKFRQTINYVEVCTENYKTYSIEYAHLLQSIGGELDCFFKQYCSRSTHKCKNIKDYGKFILGDSSGSNGFYSDIVSQNIRVIDSDITLTPYKDWNPEKSKSTLAWWGAYNSIKHKRISSMSNASMENVLNILAAIFLLEMRYVLEITDSKKEPDSPVEYSSKLFTIIDWPIKWRSAGESFLRIVNE